MFIAILGRQPEFGSAELEVIYGSDSVERFSSEVCLVDTESLDFNQLGSSKKAGRVVAEFKNLNWQSVSKEIIQHYSKSWQASQQKITLGISAYGFKVSERDVQKTGIILKSQLKNHGVSLRLIPNRSPAHNTAVSHHNKLGLSPNKVELLVVQGFGGRIIVAESIGAQNITALAARDQARPKTDAFVGMLPPKLARTMINLSGLSSGRILDPFCGTGVVLQEALLLGYDAYGTDLSEKMVEYSTANIDWLQKKHRSSGQILIEHGDAMTHRWKPPVDAIVAETYLGQPFSAPPSPEKLAQVRKNCNYIIEEFLTNLKTQINPGTTLCIAIPAWRDSRGNLSHLPLIDKLAHIGYKTRHLKHCNTKQLVYARPDQVVARQILLLNRGD